MRRAYIAAAVCVLSLTLAPGAHGARRRHRAHHRHRPRHPHLHRHPPGRAAPQGPGIVLDPATGNYLISYYPPSAPADPAISQPVAPDAEKTLLHATYVPATKVDPVVESDFVYREARHEVQYSYRIRNGRGAKQALAQIVLEPVSNVSALMLPPSVAGGMDATRTAQFEATASAALITPPNWDGQLSISPGRGLRIVWRFQAEGGKKGLAPGRAQDGFGMPADDLPGVVLARLKGDAPRLDFKGAPPDGDLADRLAYLLAHDYVTRPVAVPTIRVPDPYDTIVLIHRIQDQMHGWIRLQLLDPSFSARLNHHLRAAVNEMRYGHEQGARYELDAARLLLAVQQPSLAGNGDRARLPSPTAMQIDKLPARVLDFDLNYVEMQMEEARSRVPPQAMRAPQRNEGGLFF